MLKLKLHYFGHLMQRTDSLEKILMLGKTESRKRREWQRMRWLDVITDSMDLSLSKLWERVKGREAWRASVHGVKKNWTWLSNWTITTMPYEIKKKQNLISPSSSQAPPSSLVPKYLLFSQLFRSWQICYFIPKDPSLRFFFRKKPVEVFLIPQLKCYDSLLFVPILSAINPEYSLEGLMLKLQYFGHLMGRANSLEKALMLGKIEGRRRRGWQRMRYLDGITDWMDMSLSKLWEIVKDREAWCTILHVISKSQIWLSSWTITTSKFTQAFFPLKEM